MVSQGDTWCTTGECEKSADWPLVGQCKSVKEDGEACDKELEECARGYWCKESKCVHWSSVHHKGTVF